MRTTITIDEQVYRDAKARAAQSSQTVSQLIEDAVRASLRASVAAADAIDPLPSFGRDGVRPGVDLSDNSSVADAMDSSRDLDALR